ncbi:hypothetical protein EUGRSUZ_L00345 [Eucalyptus grandis]|uniref:Uncharacterized protein n=2 Tax=Eucalyptus grandis TaxID=71139 RepID=A0ACC3L7M7_EUCGR|nr:hypothetical protein EUGRSUZ_L00345 [Eucalyptus grandis]
MKWATSKRIDLEIEIILNASNAYGPHVYQSLGEKKMMKWAGTKPGRSRDADILGRTRCTRARCISAFRSRKSHRDRRLGCVGLKRSKLKATHRRRRRLDKNQNTESPAEHELPPIILILILIIVHVHEQGINTHERRCVQRSSPRFRSSGLGSQQRRTSCSIREGKGLLKKKRERMMMVAIVAEILEVYTEVLARAMEHLLREAPLPRRVRFLILRSLPFASPPRHRAILAPAPVPAQVAA